MVWLIGFECSQVVTSAFRELGVNAYSCDLQDTSGPYPKKHLKMDIFKAINLRKWEGIILHPPCTFTCLSGNRWYYDSPLRTKGASLCKRSWDAACKVCDKVALEQPRTVMRKYIGPYQQIIQPWQFGHGEVKETWLWLKNLPQLVPTDIVEERSQKIYNTKKQDRQRIRSVTYEGIAKAMATQWSS